MLSLLTKPELSIYSWENPCSQTKDTKTSGSQHFMVSLSTMQSTEGFDLDNWCNDYDQAHVAL